MSIAAIGAAHVTPTGAERAEGSGPDHDGDADDKGAAAPSPVQTAPVPGTGRAVDKSA
jgi:hypothetical protein